MTWQQSYSSALLAWKQNNHVAKNVSQSVLESEERAAGNAMIKWQRQSPVLDEVVNFERT